MAGTLKNLRQGLINSCSKKKSCPNSKVPKSIKNAEAPAGAKLACQKCTFLNATSASKCACCGCDSRFLKLMVKEDITECESPEDCPILCQACKQSFESKSNVYELTNCNHGFCRPCISISVGKRLLALIRTRGLDCSLSKYNSTMRCPVEGCGRTLSREDLRVVLGPCMQAMVDEWIMISLTSQVVYPLIRCCPNCKDTEEQLLIAPSEFHRLPKKSLFKAFECNGLTPPRGNQSELVKHLTDAAPISLLCSRCFVMVCPNCGLKPVAGMAHLCDPLQRQCFDITRSIMKLCSAYIQATHSCVGQRIRKKRRLCNNEGNQQMHRNELTYECLCKWFYDKGFEVEQGTALYEQHSSQGPEASTVDALAQTALQELTSCILRTLDDNKGALSSVLAALLCSNDLPYTLLKWLVRNDSLMEIAAHGDLYQAVLSFMRAVSGSCDLLPLLCSREAKHNCMATQSRWETPGSVVADFNNLFKQAQFMLRRGEHLLLDAKQGNKGGKGHGKKKQLEFDCTLSNLMADVIATNEVLHKRIEVWEGKTAQHHWLTSTDEVSAKDEGHVMQLLGAQLNAFINKQTIPSSNPSRAKKASKQAIAELDCSKCGEQSSLGKDDNVEETKDESVASVPSAALIEAYKEALRPLQFDEACLLPTHFFRRSVCRRQALMLNKRRTRAISEEMTLFNTRLPLEWESSIFLRMDEQRLDVLRALIIGPKDTPYENGVFFFDLLLEASYPDTPPLVKFLTTAGGTVRFNPNLYEDGLVCLSILGTWKGPGWMAGQSSIMQVLVSIQGLVLVADPYYNEPSNVSGGQRREADIYISEQRLNTMQHSMLPALRCPDPLFLPVIHTHFRLKAAHVLSQCTAWMQEERHFHLANQYKPLIDQLRLELDKLTTDAQS